MIPDQLTLGRPDQVQITFARKITSRTPGRFRTRVVQPGTEPQIQAHYKHSKVKQYLKEGRALSTETTVKRVVSPSMINRRRPKSTRPALRRPRCDGAPACLCSFQHLIAGLTNRTLRELINGIIPGYSRAQMTYDLRRLRRKGLIRRIPRTQRYELTEFGRMIAVFFTKTYVRILNPSLGELDPTLPDEIAEHHPLARHWRGFEHALDHRIAAATIMT